MKRTQLVMVLQTTVIVLLGAEVVLLTLQNRKLASTLKSQVADHGAAETLKPGTIAPPIEEYDLEHEAVRLGGSTTVGAALLVFFAPHCPACEIDAPSWERLSKICREARVPMVGICLGGRNECLQFVRRHSLKFPVVPDSARTIADAYGCASRIPQKLVVKSGRIDCVMAGAGGERQQAELRKRLLP